MNLTMNMQYHPALHNWFFQTVIAFVIFVVCSCSMGLWMFAPMLMGTLRAYVVSISLAAAAVLLTVLTPLPGWVAVAIFASSATFTLLAGRRT